MDYSPEYELAHYGVQGMKWGVRKQKKAGAHIRELSKKFERRGDKYADALRKHNRRLRANDMKSYKNDAEFMRANRGSALSVTAKLFSYASAYSKLKKADQEYLKQTGKSYIEQMLSEDSKYGKLTVNQYLNRVNEHKIAAEVDREMRGGNRKSKR